MGRGCTLQQHIVGVGWRTKTIGLESLGSPWVRDKIQWPITVYSLSRRGRRPRLVGVGLLAPPKHDRTVHVPWVGPAPMRSKKEAGSVHSGGETLRQRA